MEDTSKTTPELYINSDGVFGEEECLDYMDRFYEESTRFNKLLVQLEDYFTAELDATPINKRKIELFPENPLVKLINSYISDEVSQLQKGLRYINDLNIEVNRLKSYLLGGSVFPYTACEKLGSLNDCLSDYLEDGNRLPVLDISYDSFSGLSLCNVRITFQPEEKLMAL